MCYLVRFSRVCLAFPNILHGTSCWTVTTWTPWPFRTEALQRFPEKRQMVNGSAWWVWLLPCDFEKVDAFHQGNEWWICGLDAVHAFAAPCHLGCASADGGDAAYPVLWRTVGWGVGGGGRGTSNHCKGTPCFHIQMSTADVLLDISCWKFLIVKEKQKHGNK